ncbi:hypothetical protein FZEAL_9462 [Fusarium zealandicum]|uniref:Uncharacterized protein n=1 Tax=Fusarium zealandicum TaxID=1053134 RepID=A0A8H4XF81_9HYPO|nr:hypothetical protein FZEAL_9462 [Fusarium zealandicum]
MALNHFYLFPNLPTEIQALIWDTAVRPVPGRRHVQRFTITDHYFNPANRPYPVSGPILRFGRQGAPVTGWSLVVPRDDLDGSPNDSVYALDSGLWSASRDSRAALERRFRKNEWWSDLECLNHPKRLATSGVYFGQNAQTQTASYIDTDGEVRHITIAPGQDLIHLDARYMSSVDWFHHYAGDSVPLLDYRALPNQVPKPSFLGLDIAVDYDPTMLDTVGGKHVHICRKDLGMYSMSLVDMVDVLHESAGRTIWFIDYRLRSSALPLAEPSSNSQDSAGPRPSPKLKSPRVKFHSGSSVLIEVTRQDMDTGSWTIDVENCQSDSGNRLVFEFFDALFREANGRLDIENSDRLRALACQGAPGYVLPKRTLYGNRDASCVICNPKEEVRPIRPLILEDANEISLTDFNLFD